MGVAERAWYTNCLIDAQVGGNVANPEGGSNLEETVAGHVAVQDVCDVFDLNMYVRVLAAVAEGLPKFADNSGNAACKRSRLEPCARSTSKKCRTRWPTVFVGIRATRVVVWRA